MNIKKITIYISIIIIITLQIFINFYSNEFVYVLFPFFIVPTVLLVIIHPYWKVAIFSGIFMSGFKAIILFYIHNVTLVEAIELRLWVGGLVNWSVIIFLTYLYINLSHATKESQNLRNILKRKNTILETTLDSMEDFVISCDADGKINYLNNAARLSDYIEGTSFEQLNHHYTIYAEDKKRILDYTELPLYLALKGHVLNQYEIWIVPKRGGEKMNLIVDGRPIIDINGEITGAVVMFHNMTKWKLIEQEINRTKDQYHSLFQYNFDAVYSLDLEGNFLTLNPACEQLTGYPNEELRTQSFHFLIHSDDLPKVIENFIETKTGTPQNYEVTIINKSREKIIVNISNVPMIVNSKVVGVFGIAKNITQQKILEKEIQYMAYYDQLTGLANRSLFRTRALQGWEHSRKEKSIMAIMFLDLDGFKLVNDTLGHDVGDQLLIEAAARFKACLDPDDLLSRMGGDEFTILMSQINQIEDVEKIAGKLINTLQDPFVFDESPVLLSVSIGITFYDGDKDISLDTLLKQADTAMYNIKDGGKGSFSVYTEEMDSQYLRKAFVLEKESH